MAVAAGFVIAMTATAVLHTASWGMFGERHAFVPGTWQLSAAWLLMMAAVALGSAAAGGFTCVLIAGGRHRRRAATVIAVLLVGTGVVTATTGHSARDLFLSVELPAEWAPRGDGSPPAAPDAASAGPAPPLMVAMRYAETPRWYDLVRPLVTVAGVVLATRLVPRARSADRR